MNNMMKKREFLMDHFSNSKTMREVRRKIIDDYRILYDGFVPNQEIVALMAEWEIQQIRCEKIFNPNF